MRTPYLLFSLACLGMAGCASMDQLSAKLDMTEQHLGREVKPVYEGQLKSAARFGAMTSLQFSDGQIFEVSAAPKGLAAGDTVRLDQTDKGYVAHIWRI